MKENTQRSKLKNGAQYRTKQFYHTEGKQIYQRREKDRDLHTQLRINFSIKKEKNLLLLLI